MDQPGNPVRELRFLGARGGRVERRQGGGRGEDLAVDTRELERNNIVRPAAHRGTHPLRAKPDDARPAITIDAITSHHHGCRRGRHMVGGAASVVGMRSTHLLLDIHRAQPYPRR